MDETKVLKTRVSDRCGGAKGYNFHGLCLFRDARIKLGLGGCL